MRRAIVHVGLPRTGTTSLQHLFAGERDALAAGGVLYPDLTPASVGAGHLSHQHLGEALDGRRPGRERRELLDGLAAQLGRHDVVLLSYEGLCLLPWWRFGPERIARLFARAGYAMEVVATVKPQAELLNSTYTWRAQFLREERPFAAFFAAELGRRQWDLGWRLRRWSWAAAGRLTLVPVRDRRSPLSLATRFLAALGLPAVGSAERLDLRENRSPGPLAIAADLRLRGALRQPAGDPRTLTRAVERLAQEGGHDGERFNGLGEGERQRAAARWRASNDRLAHAAWGTTWDAVVAEEAPMPVNEIVSPDPATAAAIEAIVRAAMRETRTLTCLKCLVELSGIEPLTSAVRLQRSPI